MLSFIIIKITGFNKIPKTKHNKELLQNNFTFIIVNYKKTDTKYNENIITKT